MRVLGVVFVVALSLCASEPPADGTPGDVEPDSAASVQAARDSRMPGATNGPRIAAAESGESDPNPPGPTGRASLPGEESDTSDRTALNLLGRTDTDSGESRRNENVQFDPIDNNAHPNAWPTHHKSHPRGRACG